MKNFENYVVFIMAGVLLIVVLGIALVLSQPSKNTETAVISPTPFTSTLTYDKDAGDRLAQKMVSPQPLSDADHAAKEAIIANAKADTIYTSANVQVSYDRDLDIFQGEILSTNIQRAKDETKQWFLSHGVSEQGVCTIPVTFTLSSDVEMRLPTGATDFDPLAPGC
jgi:hypothetical protein